MRENDFYWAIRRASFGKHSLTKFSPAVILLQFMPRTAENKAGTFCCFYLHQRKAFEGEQTARWLAGKASLIAGGQLIIQ
jgi:hypothetical protein